MCLRRSPPALIFLGQSISRFPLIKERMKSRYGHLKGRVCLPLTPPSCIAKWRIHFSDPKNLAIIGLEYPKSFEFSSLDRLSKSLDYLSLFGTLGITARAIRLVMGYMMGKLPKISRLIFRMSSRNFSFLIRSGGVVSGLRGNLEDSLQRNPLILPRVEISRFFDLLSDRLQMRQLFHL